MASPSAGVELSKALSILAELADGDGPEVQVARNLAATYGAKAANSATAMLEGHVLPTPVELLRWENLLSEFGRRSFESAQITAVLSKLNHRLLSRHLAQMTRAEKEVLLEQLEAELKGEHT